jgi:hypothetical protein
MHEQTELLLGLMIAIQSWCHMAIARDRFFLQDVGTSISEKLYIDVSSVNNGPAEHYWYHLQVSYTVRTGNSTYNNSAINSLHISNIAKYSYLHVSQQWH